MSTTFKPLEHSLARLAQFAEKKDERMFQLETQIFDSWMPVLQGYESFMGAKATEMVRNYQHKYEQVKSMLHRQDGKTTP